MTVLSSQLRFGGPRDAVVSLHMEHFKRVSGIATSMKRVSPVRSVRRAFCFFFALLLAFSPTLWTTGKAQSATAQTDSRPAAADVAESGFRLERQPVAGGGELLTIFGRLDGLYRTDDPSREVPLVSVLRDTLGDTDPENDRLRYVWMLSYSKPSLTQRMAAAVPFLYNRAGNKKRAVKGDPPPVIDLAATSQEVWKKIFWTALQNIVLDSYGFPIKASTRGYRRNIGDYRKAQIIRALAILSLYQAETGAAPAFSASELRDIQARLMLTEKTFGGIVDDINLQRVYERRTAEHNDIRGHNWEL